jgi:Na+/proline symporter
MTASTPLLITFSAYLLLMVGIGFVAWRRTRTFDDYILGGRSLGGFVTALAAGASDMSGWLMMGLPGALYLTGASEAWIAVGLLLAHGRTGAGWPARCACTRNAPATR